jgi:predicted ATPase/DNA-binding CsgD family transcriptional regulator
MHELRSQQTLPSPLTPLIGRERELAAVYALLSRPEVRLVTLTGTGGVGKTRLALEVAAAASRDFADGICFVALASLTDPALVVSTIAQALGVREQGSQPRLHSLKDSLREKHLLLLLDNFEQVVLAASVVAELLAAAPHLQVLVTSRTSLHLSGEHEFVVPPLTLPDEHNLPSLDLLAEYEAVRLFIERARAVQSDFALTENNAATVAAICCQLDGLPLAIELAARRSKLFSPQALLPRLKSRLKLLVGGAREKPAHQQTLRGTIAWSYELLEEDEKTLFRRLAVFAGGCTLEAVEAVCNAHADLGVDVLDIVARLVDKSMLRQETQADGEPRLLMLETIREYALERLAASGEADAVWRQHVTFFLGFAEKAYIKMHSAEQSTWYNRLETEHANLRAALRWTLERKAPEMGLRLVGALYRFWRLRNHAHEGRSWLALVLEQPGAQARTLARATALRGAGFLAFSQGDFPEARKLLEESVSIGRELGATGKRELASTLAALAHVALLQGYPAEARELAGESLRLFRGIGEEWGAALALHHLGKAMVELGHLEAARPILAESAALFRAVGDRQLLAQSLNALGLASLRQGDSSRALTHLEEAVSVAKVSGAEQYLADALVLLGTLALQEGDFQRSTAFYQQSLALNRTLGNRNGIAEALAGLAEVASRISQSERAARLFGAVEALRKASTIRLSPLRRAAYECTLRDIRAQLDEAAFVAAWKEGGAMQLEHIIAYASETTTSPVTRTPIPQTNMGEASSNPPPGLLSSRPFSPHRALKQQFGGLTAREREVARLVAQGKSNRTIADELVVGVSTVEAHISHIFTKLGFSSRSQIAAWAVEKGLLQAPQDVETTNREH